MKKVFLVFLFFILFSCKSFSDSSLNFSMLETLSNGNQNYNSVMIGKSDANNYFGLFVFKDLIDDENRYAIWDINQKIRMNPAGHGAYAFSVWGDILVGDIHVIERNPIRCFQRDELNLPVTATTDIYSAFNIVNDVDGGAFIQLTPYTGGVGESDGNITYIAYGSGSGGLSNTHIFRARNGINSFNDIAYIKGGNHILDGYTNFSLMININSILQMRDIIIGEPDSGGVGYRILKVAN